MGRGWVAVGRDWGAVRPRLGSGRFYPSIRGSIVAGWRPLAAVGSRLAAVKLPSAMLVPPLALVCRAWAAVCRSWWAGPSAAHNLTPPQSTAANHKHPQVAALAPGCRVGWVGRGCSGWRLFGEARPFASSPGVVDRVFHKYDRMAAVFRKKISQL